MRRIRQQENVEVVGKGLAAFEEPERLAAKR
jgi:hypothetical protein